MTTRRSDTQRPATDRQRMRDVRHVHPDHDPRAWHWFARGPTLAADGGSPKDPAEADRAEADHETGRDVETEQLRDVSHEPSHGEGANRVWERGEDDEREA